MPHYTTRSDDVLEFICDIRFHRTFTYNSNNTLHRASYSDYGSSSSTAIVLFFGGLMGGRLSYTPLDALAKKHHIRIIHPDRPGVGGTDAVAIEDRIPTYIAMIPHLFQHLGIEHVSLAAHSFGTVYAMNVLLMYPHLLHPERPYVAFWAPWVHPDHTGVRHLQAAELLPAGVIGKFSSLARWVNGTLAPVVGMSSGLSSSVANSLKNSTSFPGAAAVPSVEPDTENRRQSEGDTCVLDLNDAEVVKKLRDFIPTFLFAENIDGVGQDTQLCLRKPRLIPWSTPSRPWEDIDDAVRQLRSIIAGETRVDREGRIWSIDTFHAQTDAMVGEKGQVWFDGCWMDDRTSTSEEDRIAYRSQIVGGSDHDFILDPAFGASEEWLKRVAATYATRVVGE